MCHRNQRPLRKAIEEARRNLTDTHPHSPVICRHYVDKLLTHFLIDYTYFEYLSEIFQSIVRSLGESVAGDEKLFHFTGNTPYLIQVPFKLANIGFWIYQLVATLGYGLPFMVHMRMMAVQPSLGESAPIHNAVKNWKMVIDKCLLVFDSYYASASSIRILTALDKASESFGASQSKTVCRFIGSVRPDRGKLEEYYTKIMFRDITIYIDNIERYCCPSRAANSSYVVWYALPFHG